MSKWKHKELTNIIGVLENAVYTSRGLLSTLGESTKKSGERANDSFQRRLDLDYYTDEENDKKKSDEDDNVDDDAICIEQNDKKNSKITQKGDDDIIYVRQIAKKQTKSSETKQDNILKQRDQEAYYLKRKEGIRKAQENVDPETIHPFTRKDFSRALNLLNGLINDDLNDKQLIKDLRRAERERVIKARIAANNYNIQSGLKSEAECFINTFVKIFMHAEKRLFSKKDLNIGQLKHNDKVNILINMYSATCNNVEPIAPLKIDTKDLIKFTAEYMDSVYSDWDRKKYERRLKYHLLKGDDDNDYTGPIIEIDE